MSPLDWSLLLALSMLWGGSFFFVGVAVEALPPFAIVLLRVAIAALALHAVVRLTRTAMPWDGHTWLAFFGMGLLNNAIPFSLIVWGQTQIASGLASILNATTPLFTVLVAHVLTADERLSRGRFAGILLGLAGVVVLIGPEALHGLGKDVLAQLAILGAALSYGFAAIFGRRFKRMGVPPLATAAGQVTASSLMLLPVTMLVDHPWHLEVPGLPVWGAVLGLALLSTALAYVVFFRILASAGAVNLSLVTFLIPVSAIVLGSAFLHETLAPVDFIGMALIGLGLAAIDGRLLPRLGIRPAE
ncbi:DMT family transporter [Dongia deserti]|uniref:DMT family transporter n=1 Tax=Dongia deserti TaxID=2268030 RepID=UPI000E652D0F|nr:DMT family transporter [Dongia deserti]